MSDTSVMEISERAQRALASSPIHALRDLRVQYLDSSLLIFGSVSTYYHKQLAQEAVRAVAEEFEFKVINTIVVR
jgi:hypothetical protein